jgi:hypothetical protein
LWAKYTGETIWDSHALEYEQDHSKLFQTSKVKMDIINDNREVVAMCDLLVGEILGLYPTYRSVMIGDLIEKEDEDTIEDYDIPKLMSLGYGEECNCVPESRDGDYHIRVTCVIEEGETLFRTPWVMRSMDDYTKGHGRRVPADNVQEYALGTESQD